MPIFPPFSLEVAEAHVVADGTARQRAAWKAAFGCGPVEVLIFELEAHIDEPGHWSGLVSNEPAEGLASTVHALRILAAVSLGEDIFEVGRRTIAHLGALASPDGSWDAPGPWPGEATGGGPQARRIWYTATIGMLAPQVTGSADAEAARALGDQAIRWLDMTPLDLAALGPATWASLVGCTGSPDAADRLLAWINVSRPASDLAWIHEACRLGGLPADHPLRFAAWSHLAATAPWSGGTEAGLPADNVDATLFATRAVVRP